MRLAAASPPTIPRLLGGDPAREECELEDDRDAVGAERGGDSVLNWPGLCPTIATRGCELMFALACAKRYGAMREAEG